MESKGTPLLWIEERERELKLLEQKTAKSETILRQVRISIGNCEDEIEFIGKLQNKDIGLHYPESGTQRLIEMKKGLEGKKATLKESQKELERNIVERDNLKVYVGLARQNR